jgi:thiosulfate/3-mercaptopyruvate sulfurtransferase
MQAISTIGAFGRLPPPLPCLRPGADGKYREGASNLRAQAVHAAGVRRWIPHEAQSMIRRFASAPSLLVLLAYSSLSSACSGDVIPRREDGYANPHLLVTASWVSQHSGDPYVRLVDMRGQEAYAAGHIPSAVRVDEGPLRNPEDRFTYLPKPTDFAEMMERAGIGNRTHVIVYDDQGGKMAARLWYVLNAFGHSHVSLVNGGWNKWIAEKRPTTTDIPTVAKAQFSPRPVNTQTCPSPELLARKPGTVILDARSPEEYLGDKVSPGAAKAGRIPGAVNVEWRENVTGPNLEFKPADDLQTMYAAKGITPGKEIVVHCASGGRAAQSLFTLKLLGYPKIRVYYGSFADYSHRSDAPIESRKP